MIKQMKTIIFAVIITGIYSCTPNPDNNVKKGTAVEDLIDRQVHDSILKVKELKIDQTKQDSIEDSQIKSYAVKRISGKHKYGGVTKIEYKSLSQILFETEQKAEKEIQEQIGF